MQDDDRDNQYFGLGEILAIVGRRWRWLVACVVLVPAIALFISFQQDEEYVARSRLLLRTAGQVATNPIVGDQTAAFLSDRILTNQLQVIESEDLRDEVEQRFDGDISVADVSAAVVQTGSDVIEISVKTKDPQQAATLVNLYATTFLDFNQTQQIDALEAASAEIAERIQALDAEAASIRQPLTDVEAQLAADPGDATLITERTTLLTQLGPRLEGLDEQRATFVAAQQNLALQVGVAPENVPLVLNEADPPSDPVSPRPVRDGIIGLMLGIGLGLAAAFAREFLDKTIRTTDDLERLVRSRYPILGVIPEVSSDEVVSLPGPGEHSAAAEAYRALRTSVRFAQLDTDMKVIQITSASAGEGKTTTAANLARVLTQAGHRVAITCCDLRRPTIHELFGVYVSPGLADVVLGEQLLADAVTTTDELTFVLPAGTSPPNPSELLGSGRAERVVSALAVEMDYVVVDTTPVLPVTDAIVVSRFADAVIVVVNAGRTSRSQLQHALTSLELASAPIIGLVLNRAIQGDRNAYGYGYGYGYGYDYSGPSSGNGASREPGTRAVGRSASVG